VRLRSDQDELTFSVEDDGCGFEPTSAQGSGLAGMEDRIVPLGGRLEVSSALGHGTTVAGAIPWLPRTEDTALSAPTQRVGV
jgi:signal transduction histidine kinase